MVIGTIPTRAGRRMENSSPLSATGLDRLEFTGKDLMVKRRKDSLRPTSLILLIFIRAASYGSRWRGIRTFPAREYPLQTGAAASLLPLKPGFLPTMLSIEKNGR